MESCKQSGKEGLNGFKNVSHGHHNNVVDQRNNVKRKITPLIEGKLCITLSELLRSGNISNRKLDNGLKLIDYLNKTSHLSL